MNGYIIYDGPSVIDHKPIIIIATGHKRPTANPKTGPMLQTWILRKDIPPSEAVKTGDDYSICGNCSLRHYLQGACYVMPFQAPNRVYAAYKRGAYPVAENLTKVGYHRLVRIGAYGDPHAAPMRVWDNLLRKAAGWTGYTHQWRDNQDLKKYVMASVHTIAEHLHATSLGWKTFRIKQPEGETFNEIICPSPKLQCSQCLKCNGQSNNVAIDVHGSRSKRYAKVLELQPA